MKKLLSLILIGAASFTSCSKTNNTKPKPTNTVVTITDTVVIGNQTWSSVNYNGSGGVNYSNGINDPLYGKLYTLTEAKALILPKGWRIPTTDDFNKLLASVGATAKDADGYFHVTQSQALQLASTSKWTLQNGTNTVGFNAYPAGFYNTEESTGFNDQGQEADFITTSTLAGYPGKQANFSIYEEANSNNKLYIDAVFSDEVGGANDRGSLRFIKDN